MAGSDKEVAAVLGDYLNAWYPLPSVLPDDLKMLVFQFAFDPLMDPW